VKKIFLMIPLLVNCGGDIPAGQQPGGPGAGEGPGFDLNESQHSNLEKADLQYAMRFIELPQNPYASRKSDPIDLVGGVEGECDQDPQVDKISAKGDSWSARVVIDTSECRRKLLEKSGVAIGTFVHEVTMDLSGSCSDADFSELAGEKIYGTAALTKLLVCKDESNKTHATYAMDVSLNFSIDGMSRDGESSVEQKFSQSLAMRYYYKGKSTDGCKFAMGPTKNGHKITMSDCIVGVEFDYSKRGDTIANLVPEVEPFEDAAMRSQPSVGQQMTSYQLRAKTTVKELNGLTQSENFSDDVDLAFVVNNWEGTLLLKERREPRYKMKSQQNEYATGSMQRR
jgi:hypothetical protein